MSCNLKLNCSLPLRKYGFRLNGDSDIYEKGLLIINWSLQVTSNSRLPRDTLVGTIQPIIVTCGFGFHITQ